MNEMENERLVITGMGTVSPFGCGTDISWKRLIEGKCAAKNIVFHDAYEGEVIYPACAVPDIEEDPTYGFTPEKFMTKKELLRSNRFIQMAVVATHEALEQAGWVELSDEQKKRTSTIIASAVGGYISVMEAQQALLTKGRRAVSAFSCPLSLINMAAGSISIKYGFQGPLYAPATACAASLQSFDEAIKVLRNNEADVAIAGGSEAPIHPLIFAGFNEIGALSKQTSQPETASRPFDANRDGFVIGEGAAMFVIEKLSHALARGAKPLAEIISYGSSSDAWHVTSGSPDGNGVARAMTYALNEARISAEAIDLLSAHATSTPVGDRLEYKAIEHVFSTADTSITAIKGAFGHLQGAANALAVAMTIKSLEHQIVPQTLNTEVFNEEMQHLDIVTGGPREKNIEYAMINGFGFGGVNGAMILKRYRGLNANDVKNNVNELII